MLDCWLNLKTPPWDFRKLWFSLIFFHFISLTINREIICILIDEENNPYLQPEHYLYTSWMQASSSVQQTNELNSVCACVKPIIFRSVEAVVSLLGSLKIVASLRAHHYHLFPHWLSELLPSRLLSPSHHPLHSLWRSFRSLFSWRFIYSYPAVQCFLFSLLLFKHIEADVCKKWSVNPWAGGVDTLSQCSVHLFECDFSVY